MHGAILYNVSRLRHLHLFVVIIGSSPGWDVLTISQKMVARKYLNGVVHPTNWVRLINIYCLCLWAKTMVLSKYGRNANTFNQGHNKHNVSFDYPGLNYFKLYFLFAECLAHLLIIFTFKYGNNFPCIKKTFGWSKERYLMIFAKLCFFQLIILILLWKVNDKEYGR